MKAKAGEKAQGAIELVAEEEAVRERDAASGSRFANTWRSSSRTEVRRFAFASMPLDCRSVLLRELRLKRSDLYVIHGLLDLDALRSLTEPTSRGRGGPISGRAPAMCNERQR
jgi:polyphosphate kinase